MAKEDSNVVRMRIHERIRKRLTGSQARPRLAVFRSNKHTYVQVISDDSGRTLAAASTLEVEGGSSNRAAARKVGERIAELCQAQSIKNVVFDRNGFLFHGRVKEVAEGARAAGLQF